MQSADNISIIVAFGGGIFSFLSPCVLPLVPSYLSFVTGMSFDDLRTSDLNIHLRQKVVLSSLFFVLGFSMVFIALGASFGLFGRFFASHQQIIKIIAGLIIIFFGLYIAGIFKVPFFMKSKELVPLKSKPAGYVGSTLIGISFGTAWTPCIGPILGAILTLAASTRGMSGGMILLTAYSMGLAIPFILAAWGIGSFLNAIRKYGRFLHGIQITGGIILIIVGLLIVTGYFNVLNSLFIGLTPSWLLEKI